MRAIMILKFRDFIEHYIAEYEGYNETSPWRKAMKENDWEEDYPDEEEWGWDHEEHDECGGWTPGGHWGRCGASGVLPIALDTGRVLLDRRGENVDGGAAYGTYGGAITDGMDEEESARHEFQEETGYTGQIHLIPAYRFEDPRDLLSDGRPWFYQNFIGLIQSENIGKIKAQQVASWNSREYGPESYGGKWASLEELARLQPKHAGLETLLQQSSALIKKYAR
jgi:8-oxo-dGTP pyrophosphatase MutT (NUDIX family)